MSSGGYAGALEGSTNAAGMRFAIVSSRFNSYVTDRLVSGARACLVDHGARSEDVEVFSVPGAWELPLAARHLAAQGFDGVSYRLFMGGVCALHVGTRAGGMHSPPPASHPERSEGSAGSWE